MIRSISLAVGCLILGMSSGCGGPGKVVVTGELRQKGEVYRPDKGEQLMIIFGEEKDGKTTGKNFPTRLAPDGTFKIAGPDNTGIRAGKYRVGIFSTPEVTVPGQPVQDKFKGAFELSKSPISVEVSSSKADVKLEVP